MSEIKLDELVELVDEELEELEENRVLEDFISCSTTGECYRKIKKYFVERWDEDVYAQAFDRLLGLAMKAGTIDTEAFFEAWNKLVADNDMWQLGSGARRVFIYTPVEIENVLKIISKDYAYDVRDNNIITRHETDQERESALKDLTKKLGKYGYEHSPRGGTYGRLELKGSEGRRGVYITFKWVAGAEKGGAKAALSGMSKEVELSQNIIAAMDGDPEELSKYIKTAGAGHGSDLQIKLPGSKPLNIEVKTSIGADFGQFKFGYDLKNKKWVPIKTDSWFKGRDKKGKQIPAKDKQKLFNDIFKKQVLPVLPKNPFRGINIKTAPLNIKNGIVVGIKTSKTTSALKNKLAKNWFGGKESVYSEYSIEELAKYYANKGDGYIQISRDGLYGMTKARSRALGLEYTFLEAMKQGTVKARVRVRIKAHGGSNEMHSFVAALKVGGKIPKSNIDLDTNEGIRELINILQTRKESLTNTELSYKILSEIIEELTEV